MSSLGQSGEGAGSAPPTGVADREEREHQCDKPPDARSQAQRDRDRVLYTPAFRRLADVTQVVPASEGHVFHNRLTHSLKVAQFGRRLAEKLVKDNRSLADRVGGIDPDVVEAACLAHDMGHPPFGHAAEEELNDLVSNSGHVRSGFEGNAQSFRIVTRLASHPPCPRGLNLTRATLGAILKYPWLRETPGAQRLKWGAYDAEALQLRFARKAVIPADSAQREAEWARQFTDEREVSVEELDWLRQNSFLKDIRKGAEAMLMDWADDVTYAVHDAVDFYCAGLVPLDRLGSKDDSERKRFFDEVFERHEKARIPLRYDRALYEQAFNEIIREFPNTGPYEGSEAQRAGLAHHVAFLVNRYISAVCLDPPGGSEGRVWADPEYEKEVFMLKQLTWHYVILDRRLATYRCGVGRIIRDLFHIYVEAASKEKARTVFPPEIRAGLESAPSEGGRVRVIADFISSMGESQASDLHKRLTGISSRSALERIVA